MKNIFKGIIVLFFCYHTTFAQPATYTEKYRPQYHFSPEKNWMNDPNGLVFYKGEYHLFYQYNPYGNRWGHMHWAHSVSEDLVHWRALPIAIPEAGKVMIFSGSAVADTANTTGFVHKDSSGPLVAIYTGHYIADTANVDDYLQAQYIAWSRDKGRTWKKYEGNPVLDLHLRDWRDPKVFWYAPGKKWIMLTVLPGKHQVLFHSSTNLKQWDSLYTFGPAGDTVGIWECPDLLQVPVQGTNGEKKWVLINSQQTTMQYFVGEFDGRKFISQNPPGKVYRPDYGPDYYAGITYNNLPANMQPIMIGWANNWLYAQDIPTFPWKSSMTLPRQLTLKKTGNEWVLMQQPVPAVSKLRGKTFAWKNTAVAGQKMLPVQSQQFELQLSFTPAGNSKAGVNLAVGNGHAFTIGYDSKKQLLYLDRSRAGVDSFDVDFAANARFETALAPINKRINLRIFFDNSLVEVYANDGEKVMTMQLFPAEADNGIQLFSEGGPAVFHNIQLWKMNSTWNK